MGVNGVAAGNWLANFGSVNPGYCLYYVWQAYKTFGASTGMSAPDAYTCWNLSWGKHEGDWNPPAGVPVFFGQKDSSPFGDVCISLGGGLVAVTEAPGRGSVTGICTIAERQAQVGRPYLGWTEYIFDCAIDFSGGGGGTPDFSPDVQNQQNWLISSLGYDFGPDGADGIKGDVTIQRFKDYQVFLNDNGFSQQALGHPLDVDGEWGDQTQLAHQLFWNQRNPSTGYPTFPLPEGYYFGPEAGGDQSISGWHSHNEDLKIWQQQMQNRGWTITVDGLYGPQGATEPTGETADVAGAFQQEKGLTVDKLIGTETWNAAWTAPVTPANPDPAPTDPSPQPDPEPEDDQWPKNGHNQTDRSNADIQRFLIQEGFLPQGSDDNQYGENTSVAVGKWQSSKFIDVDGIWGITSDGLAFPPEGSIHGVDYSFARPDPAMLASRGIKLVGRYLWPSKYNSKGITRDEYNALTSQGISVFFIYEEDGKELTGGYSEGVRVAQAAETELSILGLSNLPIYFNVDYDAADADLENILEALRGVTSIIGIDRVGLYSGIRGMKAAFDAGVITWGFQTYAWSGGEWDSRVHLQQWSNSQWDGTVDFTRAVKAEYGQNFIEDQPTIPDPDPQPEPDPSLINQIKIKFNELGVLINQLKE